MTERNNQPYINIEDQLDDDHAFQDHMKSK